jgi:tripartite-type tricarboxylate transporter receptor subunit TctC
MQFLWLARIAALALLATSGTAVHAQEPGQVKVVVGFPAGGPPDIVARRIAARWAQQTGRTVVIENRPGASGTIAAAAVAQAPADGSTLLFGVAANLAVAPATMSPAPYDATRSFSPIVEVARGAYVLLVRADAPAPDFAAFLQWAKAQPGRLNYGSPGDGSAHHLAMELLKASQQLHLVHIPYRSPLYPPLLAGDVQVIFESLPGPLSLLESGRLRALAVTGPKRLQRLPGVPTLRELGVSGMDDITSWWGFVAPARMARAKVNQLNAELRNAMADPELESQMHDWGIALTPGTPEAFGAMIADEGRHWKSVATQVQSRR